MLKVIRDLLLKVVDSIDAGNSNISEKEAFEIIDIIKRYNVLLILILLFYLYYWPVNKV